VDFLDTTHYYPNEPLAHGQWFLSTGLSKSQPGKINKIRQNYLADRWIIYLIW
jgi:hypothetical protein